MNKKVEELIRFLETRFRVGKIQMFDTRNIVGDLMQNIYYKDGIVVDYCSGWHYIEIFGLTYEEFEYVNEKINSRSEKNDD